MFMACTCSTLVQANTRTVRFLIFYHPRSNATIARDCSPVQGHCRHDESPEPEGHRFVAGLHCIPSCCDAFKNLIQCALRMHRSGGGGGGGEGSDMCWYVNRCSKIDSN